MVVISCEDENNPIYNASSNPLVAFSTSVYDLEIAENSVGQLNIPVNASILSSEDRVFNIEIVTSDNEGNTTAIEGSYSVPATVTVPANEYTGTLTINGTDVPGVDIEALTLEIALADNDSYTAGPNAIINVFQTCPVPDTFMVGDYQLLSVGGSIGPNNNTENFESGIVTITAESSTRRSFNVAILPGLRANPVTVSLRLACGIFILDNVGPEPPIQCQQPNDEEIFVLFGAASNPSTYPTDFSNDSSFNITYNEDILGSCGAPSENQTIILRKI